MKPEDLEEIKKFADSAWYYPGLRPEGDRDAAEDINGLLSEVDRLKRLLVIAWAANGY